MRNIIQVLDSGDKAQTTEMRAIPRLLVLSALTSSLEMLTGDLVHRVGIDSDQHPKAKGTAFHGDSRIT